MATELIPNKITDFATKSFWNSAFMFMEDSFDWYGDWEDMKEIISPYMSRQHKILMVGCGNSNLSEQLYKAGYHNITNIDYSEVVIQKMEEQYECYPGMKFIVMDATNMGFDNESFDFVIDKATIDAVYASDEDEYTQSTTKYFKEIQRVTKKTGYYLCITLAQKHVVRLVSDLFKSWYSRYYLLFTKNDVSAPCPFMFLFSPSMGIYTKPVYSTFLINSMKRGNEVKNILIDSKNRGESNPNPLNHQYVCFEPSYAFRRVEDLTYRHIYFTTGHYITNEEIPAVISQTQQAHENRYKLQTLGEGDVYEDDLYIDNKKKPAYTVRVYDVKQRDRTRTVFKLAVIFVPIGRELEYSFNNPQGLEEIGTQIQVDRLIMIYILKDTTDIKVMKSEVTPFVLMLYPTSADKNIPFMQVAEEFGQRTEIAKKDSSFTGEIIVEDITIETIHKRRLVFGRNRNAIQTEYIYTIEKTGNKKKKQQVFHFDEICFDIYKVMLGAIIMNQYPHEFDSKDRKNSYLIMGLGGGALCSFIYTYLLTKEEKEFQKNYTKEITAGNTSFEGHSLIDVVEIDSTVVDLAKEYFKLPDVMVYVKDAYEHVTSLPESAAYRYIIMDIDNKDANSGITFPPTKFIQPAYLRLIKSHLTPNGALLVNISSHNLKIYTFIRSLFKQAFSYVYVFETEDLNRCIYACDQPLVAVEQDILTQKYGKIVDSVNIESIIKELKQ
ncbi:hypothetical protein WA158_006831 [Blastocystis sp. Blastoise]